MFTTPRYTAVTKHTELAVFATRPLAPGTVLQELQGSVVPLPDAWREEMEIGEDFAYRAAEEDEDFSDSEAGSDNEEGDETGAPREKNKSKERDSESRSRGARRSDRTKRRDFSIVWSGLKRCFQLFLGPARFLNVSYETNVAKRPSLQAARLSAKCRALAAGQICHVPGHPTYTRWRGDYGVIVSELAANVDGVLTTAERTIVGDWIPAERTRLTF